MKRWLARLLMLWGYAMLALVLLIPPFAMITATTVKGAIFYGVFTTIVWVALVMLFIGGLIADRIETLNERILGLKEQK